MGGCFVMGASAGGQFLGVEVVGLAAPYNALDRLEAKQVSVFHRHIRLQQERCDMLSRRSAVFNDRDSSPAAAHTGRQLRALGSRIWAMLLLDDHKMNVFAWQRGTQGSRFKYNACTRAKVHHPA